MHVVNLEVKRKKGLEQGNLGDDDEDRLLSSCMIKSGRYCVIACEDGEEDKLVFEEEHVEFRRLKDFLSVIIEEH